MSAVNHEFKKRKTAFLCHGGIVCQGKKMPKNRQERNTKQEKSVCWIFVFFFKYMQRTIKTP